MLVCLATYRDRLAVLLEKAVELRLFELVGGVWTLRGFSPRPEDCPAGLARLLTGAGTKLLVCGGIRAAHLQHLRNSGLEVAPWICGAVPAVLEGIAQRDLSRLVMPGCAYEKPAVFSLPAPPKKRAARGVPNPGPDAAPARVQGVMHG